MSGFSDEILVKNVRSWAKKAGNSYLVKYTPFLDDRQLTMAEEALRGFEGCKSFGGYENARRKLLCVYGGIDEPQDSDFPIYATTFRFKTVGGKVLCHRDFLGAFMSLDIRRECVGDIVVGEGVCVAFCTLPVLGEITKVGSVGVSAEEGCDALCGIDTEQKFEDISGTVASLRLDCVAALAACASRSEAERMIAAKSVSVGSVVCENESRLLREGDVFSIRGIGKFLLSGIGNVTRKNRIHVEIKKYI